MCSMKTRKKNTTNFVCVISLDRRCLLLWFGWTPYLKLVKVNHVCRIFFLLKRQYFVKGHKSCHRNSQSVLSWSVKSELVGNLYEYIIWKLVQVKCHHAPALGMKEVRLHDDWQEIRYEKEYESNSENK